MSEKNILKELPADVKLSIEKKASEEAYAFGNNLMHLPLDQMLLKMTEELAKEKRAHYSVLYFKDKRIEELTKIIQDKSAPKK